MAGGRGQLAEECERVRLPRIGVSVSLPNCECLAQQFGKKLGKEIEGVGTKAREALLQHPFPGNVRELENVLERALTLSSEGVITPEHIRLRASVPPAATEAPAPRGAAGAEGSTALGSQLESIERDAIIKALEKTRYNKTAAAKLLGMSFRALRYRIKKLGIE